MSGHLLFDPKAESFGSPLEITRSRAVITTLGRLVCDTPDRLIEPPYVSTNTGHLIWQCYATEVSTNAKMEISELLNPNSKFKHPSFTAHKWLTSFALRIMNEEATARAGMYSEALGQDLTDIFAPDEANKTAIADRMEQAWAECVILDDAHTSIVLGQIASSYVFNATLRQHLQEEKTLSAELLVAS